MYAGRRKYELLDPSSYSIINYNSQEIPKRLLLFFLYFEVLFGSKNGKYSRNNAWMSVELVFSLLIEAECANSIWNSLNDLKNVNNYLKYCRDRITSMEGSKPDSIAL